MVGRDMRTENYETAILNGVVYRRIQLVWEIEWLFDETMNLFNFKFIRKII